MEVDLGVILFERHNSKVKLTKAGQYLKKELTINLKFGYIGSAMQGIIPNLLVKFKKEHHVHFLLMFFNK